MNRLMEASRNIANKNGLGKRKAEISPKKGDTKKRSALGDLTNAAKKEAAIAAGKVKDGLSKAEKAVGGRMTRARSKSLLPQPEVTVAQPVPADVVSKENTRVSRTKSISKKVASSKAHSSPAKDRKHRPSKVSKENDGSSSDDDTESSLYKTAVSTPNICESVENLNLKNDKLTVELKSKFPDGVTDFDAETINDPFQVGLYAEDIFAYYKRRELRFSVKKYLERQTELNRNMRAILVDWMVEVQESFELNHETLYLAVKIVDLFLGKVQVKRDKLQLVGTTALYISAKYDERCPPLIDDFCYICDDAYPQQDVLRMEARILKVLEFDIGMPLSYRFLRRYARCAKLEMETLTLARFLLETCLMDYDLIDARDSMIAGAVLMLALIMKGVEDPWNATLTYYSGYTSTELKDLTTRVLAYVSTTQTHLKTIRSKYSHKVFYEVAKIPLPKEIKL